ncbi:unnamed protein product [Protopolystoma xenopodis]|uniref:Uncharacterized protein n=1 Tax=Protopolystoma xenopodis TaxID=117903 RepID=A0A448WXZ5_9PLAT|nr:unnamed protein product [Protopolystoma xenopodis]
MQQLVIRGPHQYPGARSITFPDGKMVQLPSGESSDAVNRRNKLSHHLVPARADLNLGRPVIVRILY